MFSVVFLLFFVMGAVNAKKVPSIKPTKSPVAKPTKSKPVSKSSAAPTQPPINTVWSNNIADFNTFYPINGTMGEMQQQFVHCATGKNIYQMYGQKVQGELKSFGIICGGFGGRKWRVLGPNLVPSPLHLSWTAAYTVTQLVVYKYLDPVLNYYVVTSLEVYFNGDNTGAIVPPSKWTASPLCSAPSATCTVETTTAAAGKSLSYWYFKIINNSPTPDIPGNLLDLKVSATPYTAAPV